MFKSKFKVFAKLIALITCVITAFSVTACGGGGENSSQTEDPNAFTVLRFWNGFTGKDGETMDQMVAAFNAEYESQKIKVVADKIPWDTLFTKITTTSSNLKIAPHIVAMSASRIAGMQSKGVLTTMNDIESSLGISKNEYIESAWNGGMIGNDRYGFPLDVHPTAMYYNKNLISEDELPTTWEEFKQVCIEKTDLDRGVYGWALPSMYSITKDVYLNMLYTKGGHVFDSNNQPVYNDATGIECLEYFTDLVHGENPVSPANIGAGGDYTLFVQGKSVFYFDGPWVINTFGLYDSEDSNIGVAPCPQSVGEGNTNFAGSHQFTLMKNTVTNDKIKNACYTFIRYINEHSYDWATAGQVPALKAIHETAEYQALEAIQPFTEMAYYATLGEIGYEYWYECYNGLGVAISNAISDIYAPKAALDIAVADFKAFLEDEEL